MKPIDDLYARTLQSYSREAKEGEFDAWEHVLQPFSYREIDSALRRWQDDTEIEEYTHKPRGSRMPTAAELRLSIERASRANTPRFQACEQHGCVEGWIKVFEGKTSGGNIVDARAGAVRRCQCFIEWAAARSYRAESVGKKGTR